MKRVYLVYWIAGTLKADILAAVVIADSQPTEALVRRVAQAVHAKIMARGLNPGPEAWRQIEDLARAEALAEGFTLPS